MKVITIIEEADFEIEMETEPGPSDGERFYVKLNDGRRFLMTRDWAGMMEFWPTRKARRLNLPEINEPILEEVRNYFDGPKVDIL